MFMAESLTGTETIGEFYLQCLDAFQLRDLIDLSVHSTENDSSFSHPEWQAPGPGVRGRVWHVWESPGPGANDSPRLLSHPERLRNVSRTCVPASRLQRGVTR